MICCTGGEQRCQQRVRRRREREGRGGRGAKVGAHAFTKDEDEYILANAADEDWNGIAAHIGLSGVLPGSVIRVRHGVLKRGVQRVRHTEEDDAKIRRWSRKGVETAEINRRLNRKPRSVEARIYRLQTNGRW